MPSTVNTKTRTFAEVAMLGHINTQGNSPRVYRWVKAPKAVQQLSINKPPSTPKAAGVTVPYIPIRPAEKKPSAAVVVADPTATIAELEASTTTSTTTTTTTTTTTKDDDDEIDGESLLCPFPQCGYWPVYGFCGCIYSRRARDAALAGVDVKAASDVSATTTAPAELPPLPAKPASSKVLAAIDVPILPIVSHKAKRSTKKAAKKAAK
ncbi:hypothetical protein BC831DRAFT_527030 [Entophlyctis helioformis]|nr:hypothetical protein BC831DRAFT_527030 [Entophlyctis helioformis]